MSTPAASQLVRPSQTKTSSPTASHPQTAVPPVRNSVAQSAPAIVSSPNPPAVLTPPALRFRFTTYESALKSAANPNAPGHHRPATRRSDTDPPTKTPAPSTRCCPNPPRAPDPPLPGSAAPASPLQPLQHLARRPPRRVHRRRPRQQKIQQAPQSVTFGRY